MALNFVNYRCWDPAWVSTVLDIDADSVEDSVFMATHTDPVLRVDLTPNARSTSTTNLEVRSAPKILEELFLDPDEKHVQFAVIGETGTGKSHLIKWMDLAIRDSEKYAKIRVPRAGSTLLGVLKQIVTLLPEDQQEQYDTQINRGGMEQLTESQKTFRVLSAIALEIGEDTPQDDTESLIFDDLPSLFHDVGLVKVLPDHSPIIGELASHVFDSPEKYERRQAPRRFRVEDLQLDNVTLSDLASATQGLLITFRDDPELLESAVEIVNRNLDKAITRALAFAGEDLIKLVQKVRVHLKNAGKELIVLIEDLVRNQGYDQPLLDALLERADDQNGFCVLRWGVAVTTGRYSDLVETVRDRMSFVVNMNVDVEDDVEGFAGMNPQIFVSKYLNAVRLGSDGVRDWYSSQKHGETLASFCSSSGCKFADLCHERFGNSSNIGLYPLTENAVLNIAERVGAIGTRHNPRALLATMAEILDRRADDLVQNQFPSMALFESLQNDHASSPVLDPSLAQNLGVGTKPDAERQHVLIELWSRTPGSPQQLDDGIFESFGLTAPPDEVFGDARAPVKPTKTDPVVPPAKTSDPLVIAIRNWSNRGQLDDQFRNSIRPLLFSAIENHIDWDAEGLIKTEVIQATGTALFTQQSFEFQRQATRYTATLPVHLVLPADDKDSKELNETALALMGLVQFQKLGSWEFQDGVGQMIALGNRLDAWSIEVLRQIRSYLKSVKTWEVTTAARELLTVGALLSGSEEIASDSSTDRINALFSDWETPDTSVSEDWRLVQKTIFDKRDRLKKIAMLDASGTKGGTLSNFLRPRRMMQAVDRMARDWEFSQAPPSGSQRRGRGVFQDIESLYADVSLRFDRLLGLESDGIRQWYNAAREHIAPGTQKRRVVDSLRALESASSKGKLPVSAQIETQLINAIKTFDKSYVDAAFSAAEAFLAINDKRKMLESLSGDRSGKARAHTKELLEVANSYITELENLVTLKQQQFGIDGQDGIVESKSKIKTDLMDLKDILDRIEGTDAS